jgi:hypothetical protein
MVRYVRSGNQSQRIALGLVLVLLDCVSTYRSSLLHTNIQ